MTRHKFNAKPVRIGGEYFPSTGEYNRHCELLLLERAGKITELKRQQQIELQPAFVDNTGKKQKAIKWRVDWTYKENGQFVVEDFKGFETREFKLKVLLFLYRYPDIELRITK